MPDKPSIDELIEQLANHDTREKAKLKLIEIGESAVNPLIALVKQGIDDFYTKHSVYEVLGEIGDKRIVQSLIDIVDTAYWSDRKQAIKALSKIGDVRAVRPIIKTYSRVDNPDSIMAMYWDEHLLKQEFLTEKLSEFGEPAVDILISELPEPPRTFSKMFVAEALANIGNPRAIQPIMQSGCTRVLHKFGEPAVIPILESLEELRSMDWQRNIMTGAMGALGMIGDRRAFDTLLKLMNDPDIRIRNAAIQIIGSMEDERAIPPLLEIYRDDSDKNRDIRQFAIESIVQIIVVPTLIKKFQQLCDSNDMRTIRRWLRNEHTNENSYKRYEEAKLSLVADLNSSDQLIKQSAYNELSWTLVPQPPDYTETLESILQKYLYDDDKEVQNVSVRALTLIDTPEARQILDDWRTNQQEG